ncbi:MAG: glycosyltransferase [Crenarchaeota archaeon]|nr:glycosyltransferase [Thermoproteota archaeon]
MKICFISSYPPNRARLNEYAQNLVPALAGCSEVEKLFLLADKPQFPDGLAIQNSKVAVFRVWRSDSLFSVLNVLRWIIRLHPDIVHFNVSFQSFGKSKITNYAGLSLILLCRLFGFRVLAALHTLADVADLEKYDVKPSLINKAGILVATKTVLSAHKIAVLVKSYYAFLKKRYGHRGVSYVPHGAAVDTQSDLASANRTILFFGHMGPHKGLPLLLEAYKKIRAITPDAHLVVAGADHPQHPGYLAPYKVAGLEGVEFADYVPQKLLAQVFRRAQVVVLPYNAAPGTSGVFHLACGFGRPVVASNLSEIREIVADGASAVLVPPGDVDALADAITRLLVDEEAAKK